MARDVENTPLESDSSRHSNALVAASILIFGVMLAIGVVNEALSGPGLVTSLAIALATACGPVALVPLFLKVGFESVLEQAAIKAFRAEFAKASKGEKAELLLRAENNEHFVRETVVEV